MSVVSGVGYQGRGQDHAVHRAVAAQGGVGQLFLLLECMYILYTSLLAVPYHPPNILQNNNTD